jgi:hypothetical protein
MADWHFVLILFSVSSTAFGGVSWTKLSGLNGQQEAMLDDAADRFIAHHKGDVRKAFKEMAVLNSHLNDRLGLIIGARPGAVRERAPTPNGRALRSPRSAIWGGQHWRPTAIWMML